MATGNDRMSCATTSWVIAGLAGGLSFLLLMWIWGMGFFLALVLGAALAAGLGLLVTWALCRDEAEGAARPEPGGLAMGAGGAASRSAAGGADAPSSGASEEWVAEPAERARAADEVPPPAAEVPAPTGLVGRQDEVPGDATARPSATPQFPSGVMPPADTGPQGETPAEPIAEPQPLGAPIPGAPPTSAAGGKPELLVSPRGTADDLKAIRGVGPRMEEKLNALGVWHYDQIAGWTDAQVAWVDDQLEARGRVARDNWTGQARLFAAGKSGTGSG